MFKYISKQINDIKTYGIKEFFRKLFIVINFLLSLPFYIFAIIACLIIRFVSPWFVIRVERMPAVNFGEFLLQPALYCYKKKFQIDQPKKKFMDLVYIHNRDTIYNKHLARMWKRKFNFLPSYILNPIDKVNRILPGGKKHIINFVRERDVDYLFEKYQVLEFTEEEETLGKEMLNKFGLKDKDKFVVFHVRDKTYNLKKMPERFRDWTYHDYRHTDISKFVLAAEDLVKKGYYVFRVGATAEKPFDLKNQKIIDYANSELRSDFMDLYLGAKCLFCLSTGSGYQDLPRLFNKPLALMEVPFGYLYLHSDKHLLMTKHHFHKREKRKLSLSEIFEQGLAYARRTEVFEKRGVELIENSPEEIRDLVIEMVENLEYKNKLNSEDEKLQKVFRDLYTLNVKRFYPNGSAVNNHFDFFKNDNNYKTVVNGKIKAHFSTKFLHRNKDWLR